MKKVLFSIFLLSICLACNKNDGDSPNSNYDNYDEVIDTGGPVEEPPAPKSEVLAESMADEDMGGELWRCTSKTLKVGYNSGGQGGFPQFNPNASVIYPGSLLQGKSLNKATPDVIAVERAGGTISIDILDGSTTSFFEVDQVTDRKSTRLNLKKFKAKSKWLLH